MSQSAQTPSIDCQHKVLAEALPKQTILDKYVIGKQLDSGEYGRVFLIKDISNKSSTKYVIKLSEQYENLAHEIKVLKKINKSKSAQGVPPIIDYGIILLKNMEQTDLESCKSIEEPEISNGSRLFGYYIIPQYKVSLENLINQQDNLDIKISPSSILKICTQLLSSLQTLHNAGYTHNDIKPGNIMIDKDVNGELQVTLIDFGFSMKYLSSQREHLKMKPLETFKGNISFSSLSQMNFESTSRKDDLISLTYLMVVLLNGFKFPCNKSKDSFDPFNSEGEDVRTKFLSTMKIKEEASLFKMSQNLINMKFSTKQNKQTLKNETAFLSSLGKYCQEIQSLEFEGTPNYNKLIHYLEECKFIYTQNQFDGQNLDCETVYRKDTGLSVKC